MFPAEFNLESLVIGKFITKNGGDNIISLILSPSKEEFFTVLRVEDLADKRYSIMAEADLPNVSERTEPRAILETVRAF